MRKEVVPLIVTFGVLLVLTMGQAQASQCNGESYYMTITNADSNGDYVLLNDTTGVTIGGETQFIWCNSSANYLCYNDKTDYACYEDTLKVLTDMDEGSGSDYGSYDSDLVGYYHLNDTYDSSSNGNNLTAVNTPVATSSGYIGGAYDFEAGDQDYFNPDSVWFSSGDDTMTITAWVKPESISADSAVVLQGENGGTYGRGFTFMIVGSTDYIRLSRAGSDGLWNYVATGTTVVTTGNWHFMAMRCDGSDCYIYLDGELEDSGSVSDDWQGTSYAHIGTHEGNTGIVAPFDGIIDDVRLYDVDIGYDALMSIYNNTKPDGYSVTGSEQANVGIPVVTYNTPSNTTYFTTDIQLNFTPTHDTDLNLSCAVYVDGVLNDTYEVNNNTDKVLDFDLTGGQHWFRVNATDDLGQSTVEDIYFYVFMGINVTVHEADSNITITDWTINITNSSDSFYNTSTVTNYIMEWSDIPTGDVNITISDGEDWRYFFNETLSWNINNTDYSILEFYLEEKPSNEVTFSSSPYWTVSENTEVTVTCTPLEGTGRLYNCNNKPECLTGNESEAISLSNPYNAVLGYGSYGLLCESDETENYQPSWSFKYLTVQSGGFGCTNTSTYAFRKTITVTSDPMTLNFDTLIADNFVREDLEDVYVEVTTTTYKNESEGSVIVNTSGYSTFTVYFGSYASVSGYSETTPSGDVVNITSYTEQNSYYVLTFLEETTGIQQLPPDGNITVSLICSQGTSSFDVNDSRILIATFDTQLDEIKTLVTYSATEYYSRNRIIDAPIEFLNIYLVDANEHQVAQMLITLQDATGDFLDSKFIAKKYMEGTLETMTEHYFDAERKVVVYLINGDKYQIYVDNGDEQRNIGYLYIDPIDLSKTINIGEILTINQSVANITYTLEYDETTSSIVFSMIDPEGLVTGTEFWVYNESDDLIYYANSSNHSQVNYVYTVTNTSQDYKAKAKIHHPFYGENSITFFNSFSLGFVAPAFPFLFPFVGSFAFGFQTFIVVNGLIFTMLLFGGRNSNGGIIFVVIIAGIFAFFGWWTADALILGLAGFLAILNKLTERRVVE